MLETLLGWAVLSAVILLLIGTGFSVMSRSPPEFSAARLCFSAAYLLFAVRLGWWGVMEQAEGASVITSSLLVAGLGVLWMVTMSWVDTRQSNDLGVVRREHQEILTRFIEEGVGIRETYNSLEPVPRTAAEKWDGQVGTYLEKNLGHAYAVQFRRPPTTHPLPNLRPPTMSEENYLFYLFFNMRLTQLEGIMKGLMG